MSLMPPALMFPHKHGTHPVWLLTLGRQPWFHASLVKRITYLEKLSLARTRKVERPKDARVKPGCGRFLDQRQRYMGQETAVLQISQRNWSKAGPPGLRRGLRHASEASVPQNPCDQLHRVVHTCNPRVAEKGTDDCWSSVTSKTSLVGTFKPNERFQINK